MVTFKVLLAGESLTCTRGESRCRRNRREGLVLKRVREREMVSVELREGGGKTSLALLNDPMERANKMQFRKSRGRGGNLLDTW